MVIKSLLTMALLTMSGAFATASAQGLCEERAVIVTKLKEMYKENHVASGLENASKMVEIWTGNSGSWTILVTRASGISCVVASGNSWLDLPDTAPALGTKS